MAIQYRASDALVNGLPLGGFGCGALQVFPDGTRGLFTGLNNWEEPLQQIHWFRDGTAADFRHANPFGLFVSWKDQRVAKLLQQTPVAGCPTIQAIELAADFPIARLTFPDPDIPIHVTLTHSSPFIPGNAKDSGLPVVVSVFQLTNPLEIPVTASVLACCVNVVGSWNVSRYNRIDRRAGLIGLSCHRRRNHLRDARGGDMVLATAIGSGPSDQDVTYLASWMYATQPFRGNHEDRHLEAWRFFAADGRLPNDTASHEAMGELDEPMGALAARLTLAPGSTREVTFIYSWFMPNHLYGHRYQQWFRSAWDVTSYVHARRTTLMNQTHAWHRTIRQSGLPEWLADGLINTMSVYTAASWWTRDGRFAIYENPIKWPLMDSLDVRYYGTLPLAAWFPKLEASTMLQFAKAQRPDGRIPHDLGKAQLDCPSDGTTAGLPWKDLATKFALMAYRDVLWSQDRQLLRRLYPHVKRAMRWEFTTDRNGDGLPDNEGLDSTYDLWPFHGASAYTASIFLAALRASQRMARAMSDAAFATQCQQWFRRGVESFEDKLWTGSYYLASRADDGSAYEVCIGGQLNGQWYAHLLNLGYLLPPSHVRTAVETMLALNGQASRFGAVNAVFPDGRIDTSSLQSGNIWVGETYALASLAIDEGLIEEGLELTRRMWMTFVDQAKSPWCQPDVIVANDGRLGDGEFYLRNVAIWGVPFALARVDGRVRRMLKTLAPHLPLPSIRRRATVGSQR